MRQEIEDLRNQLRELSSSHDAITNELNQKNDQLKDLLQEKEQVL